MVLYCELTNHAMRALIPTLLPEGIRIYTSFIIYRCASAPYDSGAISRVRLRTGLDLASGALLLRRAHVTKPLKQCNRR